MSRALADRIWLFGGQRNTAIARRPQTESRPRQEIIAAYVPITVTLRHGINCRRLQQPSLRLACSGEAA